MAVFLWTRAGVHNVQWAEAWAETQQTEIRPGLIEALRTAPGSILRSDWGAIEETTRHLVARPEYRQSLLEEAEYLAPVIDGADLWSVLMPNCIDLGRSDRQLIEWLGARNYFKPWEESELYGLIGGLWHVIRGSSSREDYFNVSAVRVEPTRYVDRIRGEVIAIKSDLLHFTFYSLGRSGDIVRSKGAILPIDNYLYFLGTREDYSPRPFSMIWHRPSINYQTSEPRALAADGLITHPNTDGRIISAPIVCQNMMSEDSRLENYGGQYIDLEVFNDVSQGKLGTLSEYTKQYIDYWNERSANACGGVGEYSHSEIGELQKFNKYVPIRALIESMDRRPSGSRFRSIAI